MLSAKVDTLLVQLHYKYQPEVFCLLHGHHEVPRSVLKSRFGMGSDLPKQDELYREYRRSSSGYTGVAYCVSLFLRPAIAFSPSFRPADEPDQVLVPECRNRHKTSKWCNNGYERVTEAGYLRRMSRQTVFQLHQPLSRIHSLLFLASHATRPLDLSAFLHSKALIATEIVIDIAPW